MPISCPISTFAYRDWISSDETASAVPATSAVSQFIQGATDTLSLNRLACTTAGAALTLGLGHVAKRVIMRACLPEMMVLMGGYAFATALTGFSLRDTAMAAAACYHGVEQFFAAPSAAEKDRAAYVLGSASQTLCLSLLAWIPFQRGISVTMKFAKTPQLSFLKPCLTAIPSSERPSFLIQAKGNDYIFRRGLRGPDGSIIGGRRQAPWRYEANSRLREAQRESEGRYLGSRSSHPNPPSDRVSHNDKIVVDTTTLKGSTPRREHPPHPAERRAATTDAVPTNGHAGDRDPAISPPEAEITDTAVQ